MVLRKVVYDINNHIKNLNYNLSHHILENIVYNKCKIYNIDINKLKTYVQMIISVQKDGYIYINHVVNYFHTNKYTIFLNDIPSRSTLLFETDLNIINSSYLKLLNLLITNKIIFNYDNIYIENKVFFINKNDEKILPKIKNACFYMENLLFLHINNKINLQNYEYLIPEYKSITSKCSIGDYIHHLLETKQINTTKN